GTLAALRCAARHRAVARGRRQHDRIPGRRRGSQDAVGSLDDAAHHRAADAWHSENRRRDLFGQLHVDARGIRQEQEVKNFFALLLALLIPSAAFAQASITGVVKDASGAVLPGVTVEASSPALIEKARSVVTDGTG